MGSAASSAGWVGWSKILYCVRSSPHRTAVRLRVRTLRLQEPLLGWAFPNAPGFQRQWGMIGNCVRVIRIDPLRSQVLFLCAVMPPVPFTLYAFSLLRNSK
jgi:hypothetical protein